MGAVTVDRSEYTERLSSGKTLALFAALMALFGGLGLRRARAGRRDARTWASLALGALFAFYTLNFRTLRIRLGAQALGLRFGVFGWRVPWDNVAGARHDELPALLRLGGAGIHCMFVDGRYRVSFNFLEYPRVVVALRQPAGPVKDVSFSTRAPETVIDHVKAAVRAAGALR